MKKALKRHGSPEAITTDGLRSYKAAMNELGNAEKQEVGRWANNRVENSHLPFRRRERAMLRFRRMKTLQKFASVHANVHNHFNLNATSSIDRPTRNAARAALAEWRASRPEARRVKDRAPPIGDELRIRLTAPPLLSLIRRDDRWQVERHGEL